jgi:antitoxin MazE
MATKIQKWGNSLGVRIPKALAEQLGLGVGSTVDLTVRSGALVLRPRRVEKLSLADLLSQVTPENRHGEIDTGGAVGREVE